MARVSPVDTDEEQRKSGLIVKREPEKHDPLKRGIVIEVGHTPHVISDDRIDNGAIIFYTYGYELGDYVFVDYQNIVAWEMD